MIIHYDSDGPYYIMTPEKVDGERNIYWKMAEERERGAVTHYIKPTTNREDASIFFIRPDYRYHVRNRCCKPTQLVRKFF